ncbi:MAG: hypothetical protein ACTSW1_15940 [Candidatus Hodarchaeales archaeon]
MKFIRKIVILSFLGLFFLSFLNIGTAIENSTLQIHSIVSMDQYQEVGNNTKMNITAGQRHQFRTQSRNQIRLQVNQSVELKINESETNPAEPLPNQTRAVNRYMQLELNCTCEMNATLFRSFNNSELEKIGDANTFRWAWFNTTRNQWQYAEQNWIEHTADGATVYCNTTHFSIWTILASNPDTQWKDIGNNTRMNLTANERHQFRTQNGNQIHLQVNQSAELKINESESNPAGPLPNQTRAVNRYMQLELNCTCEMNATLFRNFTNSELQEFGDANTFRWAFFNTTRNQWQYAEQNWVEHTADGATVYCNTTHFSIWTILASESEVEEPMPGTPYQSHNGTGMAIQAGNKYQIQTQSGFSLQLQLNQSAELTIIEYEQSPKAMNQEKHQIRTQTMSIELNTSAEIEATLSYTFTNQIRSQLGVKNLEQLKFMFFNETTNSWEAAKNQWFEGETLYYNTTHFSLWTIAEEEVVEESANNTPGFSFISAFIVIVAVPILKRRK